MQPDQTDNIVDVQHVIESLTAQIAEKAQRIAMLEARIRKLESAGDTDGV